jgi:hypothetical protein
MAIEYKLLRKEGSRVKRFKMPANIRGGIESSLEQIESILPGTIARLEESNLKYLYDPDHAYFHPDEVVGFVTQSGYNVEKHEVILDEDGLEVSIFHETIHAVDISTGRAGIGRILARYAIAAPYSISLIYPNGEIDKASIKVDIERQTLEIVGNFFLNSIVSAKICDDKMVAIGMVDHLLSGGPTGTVDLRDFICERYANLFEHFLLQHLRSSLSDKQKRALDDLEGARTQWSHRWFEDNKQNILKLWSDSLVKGTSGEKLQNALPPGQQ